VFEVAANPGGGLDEGTERVVSREITLKEDGSTPGGRIVDQQTN